MQARSYRMRFKIRPPCAGPLALAPVFPFVCLPHILSSTSIIEENSSEYAAGQDEQGEKEDPSDRMARGLMEQTSLQPSPPPGTEDDGSRGADQLEEGQGGPESHIDADSALGCMITPRPGEQNVRDPVEGDR